MEELNTTTIPDSGNVTSSQPSGTDIMSVFEEGGVTNPAGDQGLSGTQGVQGVIEQETQQLEIDPRYANLPKAEALLRTYQSRYDKLYNEYNNALREIEEYRQSVTLLNQLMEDDEIFEAFVRTRKPDLIKEQDITELIKAQMEKEFGDYKPSRAEAEEEPGGKAWLYYKRLDELYEEYKNKKKNRPQALDEILKKKAEEKMLREKALQEELQKVKQTLKWSDEQLVSFTEWAQKLTPLDLAKIYNFALRSMRLNVPSAANVPGSSLGKLSEREKFLSSFRR